MHSVFTRSPRSLDLRRREPSQSLPEFGFESLAIEIVGSLRIRKLAVFPVDRPKLRQLLKCALDNALHTLADICFPAPVEFGTQYALQQAAVVDVTGSERVGLQPLKSDR
ncbi:MAG: hypothetical protein M3373_09615 [Gemmatimonadota bacterium]|nr:hypothetical protein [Gemmatimonadota bacterium]